MIHLEKLTASYNKLVQLDTSTFNNFNVISEIRLVSNSLTNFPNLSAVAETLRLLEVQRNSISTISSGIISTLIHLEELDLSNNKLTSFPFQELIPLPKLRTLNLRRNNIVSLPEVQGLNLITSVNSLSLFKMCEQNNRRQSYIPGTKLSESFKLVSEKITITIMIYNFRETYFL